MEQKQHESLWVLVNIYRNESRPNEIKYTKKNTQLQNSVEPHCLNTYKWCGNDCDNLLDKHYRFFVMHNIFANCRCWFHCKWNDDQFQIIFFLFQLTKSFCTWIDFGWLMTERSKNLNYIHLKEFVFIIMDAIWRWIKTQGLWQCVGWTIIYLIINNWYSM